MVDVKQQSIDCYLG